MTVIYVKTSFFTVHRWKDAPKEVEWLRNLHSHRFHVRVEVNVSHGDREIEFYIFKSMLDQLIVGEILPWHIEKKEYQTSCEMFAHRICELLILKGYDVALVDVNEDGDHGATYIPEDPSSN
jgi:6-pyruvoyl-tetrahydropterin synthase